jgi:uncharacterized protein (UPF0147 family)
MKFTLWDVLNKDIKVLTYKSNKNEVLKFLTKSHDLSAVEFAALNKIIEEIANGKNIPLPMSQLTPALRAYLESRVIDLPFDPF